MSAQTDDVVVPMRISSAAPLTDEEKTAQAVIENPWFKLIRDGADLQHELLPPVVEIVQGLICEQSKFVIGSGSKSFKTWLTIDLALSIAMGVPFLGRETQRREVLYVNLELKPATFTWRLQQVAKAKGLQLFNTSFFHLPLRGQLAGQLLQNIITRIVRFAKHTNSKVIVLDPVYKLNVTGDENSSRDMTIFFNQLDRLTTEAGATVVLNDHFSKGSKSEVDPLDALRGSSAKAGDLDALMILRKHEVEDCFSVDLIHRELPPVPPFVLEWQFPLMHAREDLDPQAMKKAGRHRKPEHDPLRLLSAIADRQPVSMAEWAKRANVNRSTLYEHAPALRLKGWVRTVGEGSRAKQLITEEGLAQV